ncbi:TonB-dependent receptor [Brevundimonas sp.]|uniref:TonB-dependent receptor n=1 Tax=Brevundimonas sp. TaxID=1871086 RepID=UPI001A1ADD30|nr:TonB-dependent receptor [Brevundimonas sp.]MBJ7485046.1 TonB-dependent receptor [Brevundimonas sp.]
MRNSQTFQFALTTGVSALAMTLALAGAAHAQAAPSADAQEETQVDEVVVTGFRASLQSAVSAKRRESGVVDVIKAEDIADFPDLNLAESLQRVPGVTISRANGEGRQISVRGLGSEYTRVRVNGMEAIATTGGTVNSGGTNRSRGFDFNMFASELFNSLTVRKSASADVEEGSLGATVDLQTARPFDYREPTLVMGAQVSYNDLAQDAKPRFTLLASDTWMDGKFGALISAAYEQRHILEEGANITRWTFGGANGGFNTASTLAGYTTAQINSTNTATALYHPRIPAYVQYDHNTERLGLTGSFQFRPDDQTTISLDVLYSDVKSTRDEAQLQAIGFSRAGTGKPQTIIRSGTVVGNNIVSGVFDAVDVRTQSAHDELQTQFQQYTLTATRNWTDRFRTGFVGGYSRSEFSNPVSTIVTFDRANTNGFSYDFTSRMPKFDFGFDLTNPANWSMINGTSEVRIRPNAVTNTFTTAKGYFEFDANENVTLKGGLDYRRFSFDSEGQYRTTETVVQTLTASELAAVSRVFSGFGQNQGLPTGSPTSWLAPDLDKFIATYNIYSNTGIYALTGLNNSSARGQYITVDEKDLGAYAQADFRFDAFGMPWRGDAGVRYVLTEQYSDGFAATGGTIQLVRARRDYDMWLPSANLAVDLTDDVVVRLSAAQTIARPSISVLTPGGDVGIQGANRSFSSGNPNIMPTKSDNVDFSLEWYPDADSLFALGVFYKKINTFVQTLRQDIPFNQLGLPTSLLTGTTALPTDLFVVTQPVNSPGGTLQGFEVNAQKRLDFLPGWMSNFGVQANYTFVDSSIEYLTSTTAGAPTINETLVGLSKNAANFTLYYETEKFSVRGSAAYRQGYLTQVPGNDGNSVHGTNETLNFDAQASYNITENLKVSVEGINLTDEFNDQYVDASNRLNVYSHTGRQFFAGIRYTF